MTAAVSLSARACAAEILAEILDRKRPFDEALARHQGIGALEERDRNFVRLMVMTCLRRFGQIDALLAPMLEKPLTGKNSVLMHLLRLGVVQLLWLKTPPHAAVHSTVGAAEELHMGALKGLANAVLKRVAREGEAIIAAQDEVALNLPRWMHESWRKAYGEETVRHIAAALQTEPALDVTVKENPSFWAETLGGKVIPGGSVRVGRASPVHGLSGFAEGAWWVQDAAASWPVKLLGDVAGKKVLDLCAAPGGKTAQLAAGGASVTAVDQSARRLERLRDNMRRLQFDVQIVEADVLRWKPVEPVDIVLLDAPCSATGTLRRHPEVLRHKSTRDVAELAVIQKKMLNRASQWVKKGGLLLYCVCSLQPEEGETQIEDFLCRRPDFSLLPVSGVPPEFLGAQGALRTTPALMREEGGMDGFYAAVLFKQHSES